MIIGIFMSVQCLTSGSAKKRERDAEFKEKLQSLSFPRKTGQTERKYVQNQETGNYDGGYHDIHWDGSQDAHVVIPEAIKVGAVQQGKDPEAPLEIVEGGVE